MSEADRARKIAAPDGADDLEALARAWREPLRRYFEKRRPRGADADDLVQDVFERLARRADLAAIRNIEGYLFQTAAHALTDHIRRRSARKSDQHDTLDDQPDAPREERSPERVLLAREDVDRVLAVLAELPERTQTVFALNRWDGLSYREVARFLRISQSAVEKHMTRALAHLDARLGGRP